MPAHMKNKSQHNQTGSWEDRLMSLLYRLLYPGVPVMAVIVVSAVVLLILCLNGTILQPVIRFFSYHYSTYALVILSAWLPELFRQNINKGRINPFSSHPRLNRIYCLLRDMEKRTQAILLPSLIFNLSYSAIKLLSAFWLGSPWLFGMGLYYAILAVLRFTLLRTFYARQTRPDPEKDWRVYRQTARWLLGLTLVMAGLIVQMILSDQAYHYPGILIYAFALYAFVKIITAVFSLIRHRHKENRLLAASRCISFACALMSLLALQTALIDRFGDTHFAMAANSIFGTIICVVMILLCIYMLKRPQPSS